MSDFTIERRPVQGYAKRVGLKPRQGRSIQARCVDLLQAEGLSEDEQAFVRDVSRRLQHGGKLQPNETSWLLRLWTSYCRWGAG